MKKLKKAKSIDDLFYETFKALGSGVQIPMMSLEKLKAHAVSAFLCGESMEIGVFEAISLFKCK